jgi:hypothetical protein
MGLSFLPDKLYKICIYIGTGLLIYSGVNLLEKSEKLDEEIIKYTVGIKKHNIERDHLKDVSNSIRVQADNLSKLYSVKNPLTISDSGYILVKTLKGNKNAVLLSDSITSIIKESKFEASLSAIKTKDEELSEKLYEIDFKKDNMDEYNKILNIFVFFGLLFFFGGGIWGFVKELADEELSKRQNINIPTYSNQCQSCGSRFNSIVKYGKEADGNRNYHFCENCYTNGTFTNPELTISEMQSKLLVDLKAKGANKLHIYYRLYLLPGLERWNY